MQRMAREQTSVLPLKNDHMGWPDAIVTKNYRSALEGYTATGRVNPLLLFGDALAVLKDLPDSCIDFAMTSPPYWGKREYESGGVGLESDYRDYVRNLSSIFLELRRILKFTGSFWLNIGDSYSDALPP